MRAIELEAWARGLIERSSHGPQEDARVELKSEWPADPNKCARRIAGHCNAARGDSVLWIVGVAGSGAVVGVQPGELANWWAAVKVEFCGEVPGVQELILGYDTGDVVVLLFDAARAPFVVRNARYGMPDGGAVEREVPWREGTAVRTATRADLVNLLVPLQALPTIEVMSAAAHLHPNGDAVRWAVDILVYATLPMGSAVVLPDHLATAQLSIETLGYSCELVATLAARQWSDSRLFGGASRADSRLHTVKRGDAQLILDGPGFFRVLGTRQADEISHEQAYQMFEPLSLQFHLRPVGADQLVAFAADLAPDAREPEEATRPEP